MKCNEIQRNTRLHEIQHKKKHFSLVWYFPISQIVGELKKPTNQAREWPKPPKESVLLKIAGRKKISKCFKRLELVLTAILKYTSASSAQVSNAASSPFSFFLTYHTLVFPTIHSYNYRNTMCDILILPLSTELLLQNKAKLWFIKYRTQQYFRCQISSC